MIERPLSLRWEVTFLSFWLVAVWWLDGGCTRVAARPTKRRRLVGDSPSICGSTTVENDRLSNDDDAKFALCRSSRCGASLHNTLTYATDLLCRLSLYFRISLPPIRGRSLGNVLALPDTHTLQISTHSVVLWSVLGMQRTIYRTLRRPSRTVLVVRQ